MVALDKFIVCTPVLDNVFFYLYGFNLSAIKLFNLSAIKLSCDKPLSLVRFCFLIVHGQPVNDFNLMLSSTIAHA